MAHCISLDETIPTKSMDIATQNVTHIHYANSQSQTNNSKVGCYQNAETYRQAYAFDSMTVRHEQECPNCHNNTSAKYYFPDTGAYAGYYCGYCNHWSPESVGNRGPFYQTKTRYRCPYTAGETLMSISVMHMDKVGARRTLTINFDDQITNAGSVISYAWNTGATTQSITVNQRGTYYCDVTWKETQSQVNHTVRLTYTF